MAFHISSLLKQVPEDLSICQNAPSTAELDEFTDIRERYATDPFKVKAEGDKIRAFRLMRGMKRYTEIGTFDKFNLRYAMGLLELCAIVIDFDIAENPCARRRLESEKPDHQEYYCLIGDSSKISTSWQLKLLSAQLPSTLFSLMRTSSRLTL